MVSPHPSTMQMVAEEARHELLDRLAANRELPGARSLMRRFAEVLRARLVSSTAVRERPPARYRLDELGRG